MEPHEPNYRTIPLTRGMCAIIDAKNYDALSQWKWFAMKTVKRGKVHFYAARSVWSKKRLRQFLCIAKSLDSKGVILAKGTTKSLR